MKTCHHCGGELTKTGKKYCLSCSSIRHHIERNNNEPSEAYFRSPKRYFSFIVNVLTDDMQSIAAIRAKKKLCKYTSTPASWHNPK